MVLGRDHPRPERNQYCNSLQQCNNSQARTTPNGVRLLFLLSGAARPGCKPTSCMAIPQTRCLPPAQLHPHTSCLPTRTPVMQLILQLAPTCAQLSSVDTNCCCDGGFNPNVSIKLWHQQRVGAHASSTACQSTAQQHHHTRPSQQAPHPTPRQLQPWGPTA